MSFKACMGFSNSLLDMCTLPDMMTMLVDAGLVLLVARLVVPELKTLGQAIWANQNNPTLIQLHRRNNNQAALAAAGVVETDDISDSAAMSACVVQ